MKTAPVSKATKTQKKVGSPKGKTQKSSSKASKAMPPPPRPPLKLHTLEQAIGHSAILATAVNSKVSENREELISLLEQVSTQLYGEVDCKRFHAVKLDHIQIVLAYTLDEAVDVVELVLKVVELIAAKELPEPKRLVRLVPLSQTSSCSIESLRTISQSELNKTFPADDQQPPRSFKVTFASTRGRKEDHDFKEKVITCLGGMIPRQHPINLDKPDCILIAYIVNVTPHTTRSPLSGDDEPLLLGFSVVKGDASNQDKKSSEVVGYKVKPPKDKSVEKPGEKRKLEDSEKDAGASSSETPSETGPSPKAQKST